MSGTTRASIVGVNCCSSPSVASRGWESGNSTPVHELERVVAHHDHEPRLDDPELAREPVMARVVAGARELHAVRAEHLRRVDVAAARVTA